MLVSIIIPVYNVEKYLARCLESVSNQTYSDLEVILIDDGSTDTSGLICDTYVMKHSNSKVIHKKNGGLSSARNEGVKNANGKYVTFLDSDDYLAKDFIQSSIELCLDNNAQISILDMVYIGEDTSEECELLKKEYKTRLLSPKEAIEESLLQIHFSCSAPAKMYRRDIVDKIQFPEGRLCEDLATCHLFLNKAEQIVYSNRPGYYYRQHNSSIMHVFNPRRLDAVQWAKNIEKFTLDNYSDIYYAAKVRMFNVCIHLILDIEKKDEIDLYCPELWDEIKKTRWSVLLNKKTRMREKAAAILSFCGTKMLKKIWSSKVAVKHKEI